MKAFHVEASVFSKNNKKINSEHIFTLFLVMIFYYACFSQFLIGIEFKVPSCRNNTEQNSATFFNGSITWFLFLEKKNSAAVRYAGVRLTCLTDDRAVNSFYAVCCCIWR